MFAKLLKHDLRAVRDSLGLVSLIGLLSGLVGCGALRVMEHSGDRDLITVFAALALVTAFFCVILVFGACVFLVLAFFYKSRFTDQGYLTFTLPVKNHENLLSAFCTCVIGCVVGIAVFAVSMFIILFFGGSDLDGRRMEMTVQFADSLGRSLEMVGIGNAVLFGLYLIAGSLSQLLVAMLAITIGSIIAKKHKVLAALAVFHGVQILLSVFVMATFFGSGMRMVESGSGEFFTLIFPQIILYLVIGLGSYFLMHGFVSKRLNLN